MDRIYADNEINYLGIGMYERWLGDPLSEAKAITLTWKETQYPGTRIPLALGIGYKGARMTIRTWAVVQVAAHRDRREADAKLRKLSMKTKVFSCLALAGLSVFLALVGPTLCVLLSCYWAYISSPKIVPMKTADVRQMLEKCSSETEIQAEVDSLFVRFGDKDWNPDLSTTPGLARCGKALRYDPLWDIVPSGYYEIGVPSHVQVRFGQHFHYQYVLFFRTGSDLSSIKSPFEKVANNVYFKP